MERDSAPQKIYVFSDMEGISGVTSAQYLDRDSELYAEARQWLTQDVNSAILGAIDSGVTEVNVLDLHDYGDNISTDDLDPHARLESMAESSIDSSFMGLILVGYHARAGAPDSFLDHTMNGRSWTRVEINGHEVGEIWMAAAYAGHFDVPLILVTGDQAACREAEMAVCGVVTASVKQAIARDHARCLPPQDAGNLIRRSAARAVEVARDIIPMKIETPCTIYVTYKTTDFADLALEDPRFERVDDLAGVYGKRGKRVL